MMLPLSDKALASAGLVILNIIRLCNLVCFLTLVTLCGVMMANMVMMSQFYFFGFAEHIVMAFITIFLFISELDILPTIFSKYWPLFGYSHGMVFLGVAMMALGISVLSDLRDASVTNSVFGSDTYQLTLSAGCLLLSLGPINIISSFIFSNSIKSARQVRTKRSAAAAAAAAAGSRHNNNPFGLATVKPVYGSDISTASTAVPKTSRFSTRLSRLVGHLGVNTHATPAQAELPSYHSSPVPSSHYTERTSMESSAHGLKIVTDGLAGNPYLSRPQSVVHAR